MDSFFEEATPFAQPILKHIRKIVHAACPSVIEEIKWGKPWFMYQGKVMCGAVPFKAHCAFLFNKGSMIQNAHGKPARDELGKLRKITSLEELPSAAILKDFVKQAMKLNEPDAVLVKRVLKKKAPFKCPADLSRAIKASPKTLASYKKMIPSVQRHYVEWVEDAKTDTTRKDRISKSIKCIAAGKIRHWK